MKHFPQFSPRKIALFASLLLVPVFGYIFWQMSLPEMLVDTVKKYDQVGEKVQQDLLATTALSIVEKDDTYEITDTKMDGGIDIQYRNPTNEEGNEDTNSEKKDEESTNKDQSTAPKIVFQNPEEKPLLTLDFPKDYSKPIDVKLDNERTISITDLSGKSDYAVSTLAKEIPQKVTIPVVEDPQKDAHRTDFQKITHSVKTYVRNKIAESTTKVTPESTLLHYESRDGRKSLLYAFEKDPGTGEKKLKHWTLYESGTGVEQEQYKLSNAKVRINSEGIAEVYYFGAQEIQNEQVKVEVGADLMARAQRTLEKEMGENILFSRRSPDFTIPAPYYIDKDGRRHDITWQWDEDTQILSVKFTPDRNAYPIALDPTLSFVAPGQSNSMSVITGASGGLATGDFNNDGKADLAVGSNTLSSASVYIFYGGIIYSKNSSLADVIISGSNFSYPHDLFAIKFLAGDFTGDEKDDLIISVCVGEFYSCDYNNYVFFNNSITTRNLNANDGFFGGGSLALGDFNNDGKKDLVVGNAGGVGQVSIFYAQTFINFASPSVTITGTMDFNNGQFGIGFGSSVAVGDFNSDGKDDLAGLATCTSSAYDNGPYPGWYCAGESRIFLFYNSSVVTTNVLSANRVIIGSGQEVILSGDFNTDGQTDLLVRQGGNFIGINKKILLFYNNAGTIPLTPDAEIIGPSSLNVCSLCSIDTGDFNNDGRTDIIASNEGYTNIIYNDGAYPASTSLADVTFSGTRSTGTYGFLDLAVGDLNDDGKDDIIVDSSGSSVYILYSQNGQINTNQHAIGGSPGDAFGTAMASGDFNADGMLDLIVGAPGYATGTGRAYIFYNRGLYPKDASTADVIMTGEGAGDAFGSSLTSGDWDKNGKTDIVIGATGYATGTGRAYVFYADGTNNFGTVDCSLGLPALCNASNADTLFTGEVTDKFFGSSFAVGDWNRDGTDDLAIGAKGDASGTGRVSVLYAPLVSASVVLTGETVASTFGHALISGDWNHDNKADLAVGAPGYSSNTGRAYIFYNSGTTLPTTASATITGSGANNSFGYALATEDFNANNQMDLVVGTHIDYFVPQICWYDDGTDDGVYYDCSHYEPGKVYIFSGDGTIPASAGSADIILSVSGRTIFGAGLAVGDFNADGKKDLAVGAPSTSTGATYIFYNDGSLTTPDVTIQESIANSFFGTSLVAGDFNADGRTNLVVGSPGDATRTGRISFYETRENFVSTLQTVSLAEGMAMTGNLFGQEQKISGAIGSEAFGSALATGDFNNDGKKDLVVGAKGSSSLYIFYDDGEYPVRSTSADHIITGSGQSINDLGTSLITGDFNDDGKTDIATSTLDAVYIFYNDGSYPDLASGADVIINGETAYSSGSYFGSAMVSEDVNDDGKTDLVIGSYGYSTSAFVANHTGRVYVYYADGTKNFICVASPCTASDADVIINGADGSYLGYQIVTGDLNDDGKTDLAVSAPSLQVSNTGRVYMFYADGTNDFGTASCTGTPALCDASNADMTIMSETVPAMFVNGFGFTMASGDLNGDGKTDLAIGVENYQNDTPEYFGRVYLVYNDGSYPANANASEVIMTGTSGTSLGTKVAIGDVNRDSRSDLLIWRGSGISNHFLDIFFNDESGYPTTISADSPSVADASFSYSPSSVYASSARVAFDDLNADGYDDFVLSDTDFNGKGKVSLYTTNDASISGEATGSYFGSSLTTGDFNSDGRIDLAVGAPGYLSNTGRVYLFYNDSNLPSSASLADRIITGESVNDRFGKALSVMDSNTDGKIDLVVGASGYSVSKGALYIFENTGSGVYPESASGKNAIIVGESNNSYFGGVLASGDIDYDGWTDIVASANGYALNAGRVYTFYADGTYPVTADFADSIITGETGILFGSALATGDFDKDGDVDIVSSAPNYLSGLGRVYIFRNTGAGIFPSTVATANSIITGVAYVVPGSCNYDCSALAPSFGSAFVAGDFNTDGKIDLAVGSYNYGFEAWTLPGGGDLITHASGRVYIFYNTGTGTYPASAENADVTMTPENDVYLGSSLSAGDFNDDGRTDLIADTVNGVYLFVNDGVYPGNANPDAKSIFDTSLRPVRKVNTPHPSVVGDFNNDGKIDIVVGIGEYYYYGLTFEHLLNTAGYITTTISEIRTIDRFQLLRFRGNTTNSVRFRGDVKVK